ncbi:hypothetical protein Tco_0556040 [Tanacetum coccineum]
MEYLAKIRKKACILELKQRHLKITVLTSNMPYPSRKIQRVCSCTSLKTTKEQGSIRRIQRSIYAVFKLCRSLGLAACASLESKNEVCLLCEVNPKQIPAFDFICASLESISAIEETWERGEVWEQNRMRAGFGIGGRKVLYKLGCDRERLKMIKGMFVIPKTTNLPPIPKVVTETPVTTSDPRPYVTPIILTVKQTTTPIPTPTITIDAPTITTAIPKSNALSAVEIRVAKLEKDVSQLKFYLDTKVGDVYQKELQKHTADLIHKYSLQHLPELTKKPTPTTEQDSEKIPSKILKIKKEQAESQKNPQFTIKSTDKAALEEYDLKRNLYQSLHANKSFNKNPANHRLYHALMEALIEDENAMDKGVADTVKDHKRKHDDDEDDDDEDPPAGPNQGKKTKRRRTKESESSKKPSSTKDTTKGKTPTKGSKTGKSALAKEPVEEPIAEVIMDDAGDDQPPRPPTPDPEWNKRQVVLDQPTQPWFNQMVSALKDPLTFNDLMATPIDFSKNVFNGLNIENLTQDILLGPASIYRYPFDLSNPLPLQGPLGHRTVAAGYFFNNDLEYLKTSDPEVTYTTSIMKIKAARYKIKGIEDMVNKFSKQNVYSTKAILGVKSVSVKKLHGYGHLEEIVGKRYDEQLYTFKEGDFVDLHLNDIKDMLLLAVQHKLFYLDRNVIVDFIVALRMFTRSLILKRRVEDLQLGVESYQKKLNITKP